MKKDFFKGYLAGLVSMFCIASLCFTIYVSFNKNVPLNDNDAEPTASAEDIGNLIDNLTGKQKDEKTFTEKLNTKISAIKGMVDYYYYEEVTEDKMLDGICSGMLASLGDPYSTYYTEDEYAKAMESSSGIYCGIGATVSQNYSTNIISIVKPFVDGPAYKAGMLPGDIIYKVNDEDVTALDLTEVVSRMKGEAGTKVKVTVAREGADDFIDLDITRAEIEVPTIEYEMLADNIGYILISEFDEVTVEQFRLALDTMTRQGMKGLVIDLRDNPGGLYTAVVEMLDRMLPEGLIVYTEDKYGNQNKSTSSATEEFTLPLAVIINGNSASASEIFAGAIQDYEKGTIVGTKSFGKGIVQSIIPLGIDNSAVKLTVYHYFTPKGRMLHGEGVTPDVEIELDEELRQKVVIEHDEDNQLQKAIECVKEKIKE